MIGGSEPGRTLYVCRASYRGGMHPGKWIGGRCNIGYGGQEHGLAGELLVTHGRTMLEGKVFLDVFKRLGASLLHTRDLDEVITKVRAYRRADFVLLERKCRLLECGIHDAAAKPTETAALFR